jgi:DNA-binding FadR family transcriptional regulator
VASEHELADANGVSRPTARAALQELEHRYLVRRVPRAGTRRRPGRRGGLGRRAPDPDDRWADAVLQATGARAAPLALAQMVA